MDIRTVNNIRCYSGDIAPESGVVFVFGSNPEGRHGAGAAKVARERFGAVYGRGEGLQGNAYALPTKDLRVTENRGFRSISPETITQSIKRLYETARQHPDKSFCIAYRNTDRASLNGYTGIEMMRMFNSAGRLPDNVIVSEEWAKTGILKKTAESEFLTEGNDRILKQYDAYRVIVPGINLAVDTRMDKTREWFELVNDNGERLVRAANYVTGDLRSYDSAHFENATIGPDGSITLDAVAHSISPEGDVETSERAYRVTFTRKELMEMTSKDISDTKDLILNVDGSPKLLWHGSPAEFDIFDFSHAGENTGITEYTNRATGEKVTSDSDKAIFFTDNRELAISYGFLARTQQLSRYSDLLTDIGSLLNNPEGSILSRIHSKAELIDAVGELRKEGDAEMDAVLDKLPDLTGEYPLSSMAEADRKALAKDVFEVRNRYSELHRKNSHGGLSNQLNNFVRQKDYLAYFAENLDRLCANDPTVRTEFDKDFNTYNNTFFGPDHGSGVSVFLESETRRMKAAGFHKEPVYLDTLTPSGKKDFLQKIEDDLNACIENYNKDIEAAGFKQSTHLYPVHIKARNPLVHDYQGSSFPDKYIPNEKYDTAYVAARQVKKALADGNDAVIYKNIRDPFLGTTYGVFSTENIVMLDRSLLPKEQLDCTLEKVSGTVQRYMDATERSNRVFNGNTNLQGDEKKDGIQGKSVLYPTPVTHPSDGRMNYRDANGSTLLHNWVEKAEPFKDGKANVVFRGLHFTINDKGYVIKCEEHKVSDIAQAKNTGTKIR